jgi:hypothetical protein
MGGSSRSFAWRDGIITEILRIVDVSAEILDWKLSNTSYKRVEFCLLPSITLVFCLAYSSTLKLQTISSSETSVDFQGTI